MCDSWLHEAVCRQRPKLWVTVGWLHEAVCRQRPELWVTVGYMKLFVDRDMNCG